MRIVKILLLLTAVTADASVSATDGTSNSPARLRGADRRRLQRPRRHAQNAQKQGSGEENDTSEVQARIEKRTERRYYNQGNASPDETSKDDNDRWKRRNYNNNLSPTPNGGVIEDGSDRWERRGHNNNLSPTPAPISDAF